MNFRRSLLLLWPPVILTTAAAFQAPPRAAWTASRGLLAAARHTRTCHTAQRSSLRAPSGLSGLQTRVRAPDPGRLGTAAGGQRRGLAMSAAENVFFSHDGGVDDIVTLALMCAAHKGKKINLLGVAVTAADCEMEPAVITSRKILDLAALDAAAGAEEGAPPATSECSLTGVHPFPSEWRRAAFMMMHLPMLLRDGAPRSALLDRPASQHLTECIRDADGPVTILETGPLSCVAECLRSCPPEVKAKITRVVWMGGAVDVEGNVEGKKSAGKEVDGSAEWNVYWDAPAAKEVLRSGVPLVLTPLDCTNAVPITTDFLTRLSEASEGAMWGELVGQMYAQTMRGIGFWHAGYFAWDVLAASYVLWPEIFESEKMRLEIVTEGASEGRTRRCEPGEGDAEALVLVKCDAAEWEARLCSALCVREQGKGPGSE